jgi:hypothetical protein
MAKAARILIDLNLFDYWVMFEEWLTEWFDGVLLVYWSCVKGTILPKGGSERGVSE